MKTFILLLALSAPVFAQHTFPALDTNNKWTGQNNLPISFTVANLPVAPEDGMTAIVTDGNGVSCTSGGGSTMVLCRYSATALAWQPVGGSSVGGSAGQVIYSLGSGQSNGISGLTYSGSTLLGASGLTVNFAASTTMPVQVGTAASRPGTCASGQLYFETDPTPGQNLYGCVGTQWYLLGQGASGGTPGGATLQLQYNNNGAFGGIANPASPNGVSQALICNPSAGSCTPQFALDSFPPNVQTGNYTVQVTDRGAWLSTADTANDVYTAPDPTASGFGNNFGYVVCNDGTGTITENASGTSVFNPGGVTSISIPPHWCTFHVSDNTNIFVRRFSDLLGYPGTGAQSALTFNQTTGTIGTISNLVTQSSSGTAGYIPKWSDANNLSAGMAVAGTDAQVATTDGPLVANQPACGDSLGGVTTTGCAAASGGSSLPNMTQAVKLNVGLSSTAATTVANTASATTLLSSFEGMNTVPADSMLPVTFGTKTLKVRAFGSFASVTTPNLTLTPMLGGVAFGSGFQFTSVPAGPVQWQLDFYFTVTGLTTAQYGGCASYVNSGATTQVCISGQATGLNFTTNQNLDLQATWSAASASNTVSANEITAYPVHSL